MSLKRLLSGKHSVANVTANAARRSLPLADELPDGVSPWTPPADTILTTRTHSFHIWHTISTCFPIEQQPHVAHQVQNVYDLINLHINQVQRTSFKPPHYVTTNVTTYMHMYNEEIFNTKQVNEWLLFHTVKNNIHHNFFS